MKSNILYWQESLKELNGKKSQHKVIQVLINLALDRKATVRELSSVLISDMYGTLLSQDEVSRSFSGILAELPDLTIDAPEAPTVCQTLFFYNVNVTLKHFIARHQITPI